MSRPDVIGLGPRSQLDDLASAAAAQAGAENFPVALRIVPSKPRAHLQRLYAYARFVDDVGDEARGDRVALLDLIAEDVERLYTGSPVLGVVADLQPLVTECGVPAAPFLDLIAANRLDQDKGRYGDYAELLDYCRLSANPIGLVVLYIAGRVTQANVAASDEVCSALQVLEHCQDVGEDLARNRVYLPADDLRAVGVTDAELVAGVAASTTSPAVRAAVARQVDRADTGLLAGRALVKRLRGWSRVAVAAYVAGGLATVDALRAADYDVLGQAVRPGKGRTLRHTARLVIGR